MLWAGHALDCRSGASHVNALTLEAGSLKSMVPSEPEPSSSPQAQTNITHPRSVISHSRCIHHPSLSSREIVENTSLKLLRPHTTGNPIALIASELVRRDKVLQLAAGCWLTPVPVDQYMEIYRLNRHMRPEGSPAGLSSIGSQKTVQQIIRAYPKGRYFVVTSGHAMALIDGRLVDSALVGPGRAVQGLFEVSDQHTYMEGRQLTHCIAWPNKRHDPVQSGVDPVENVEVAIHLRGGVPQRTQVFTCSSGAQNTSTGLANTHHPTLDDLVGDFIAMSQTRMKACAMRHTGFYFKLIEAKQGQEVVR